MADRSRRGPEPSRRPAKSWAGLRLVDRRLVFGRTLGLPRRIGFRFEPDALVVFDRSGDLASFDWDHYKTGVVGAGWSFTYAPPVRGPGGVSLCEFDHTTSVLHDYSKVVWLGIFCPQVALVALIDYLARVPSARVGLTHPDRLVKLIEELRGLRHARAPRRYGLTVNGHDVPLDRVLREAGVVSFQRSVRGARLPALDDTVADLIRSAPLWSRLSEEEPKLRRFVERVYAEDAWPFDVLGN